MQSASLMVLIIPTKCRNCITLKYAPVSPNTILVGMNQEPEQHSVSNGHDVVEKWYFLCSLMSCRPWDCCVMRGPVHVFLYEKRAVFRVCHDQYLPDRTSRKAAASLYDITAVFKETNLPSSLKTSFYLWNCGKWLQSPQCNRSWALIGNAIQTEICQI